MLGLGCVLKIILGGRRPIVEGWVLLGDEGRLVEDGLTRLQCLVVDVVRAGDIAFASLNLRAGCEDEG